MRYLHYAIFLAFLGLCGATQAQTTTTTTTTTTTRRTTTGSETHGNTLNLGIGIGYRNYNLTGNFAPAIHFNYEFQVARNFTLAPFVTVYSSRSYRYWGNPSNPYQNYYYRHTVVPIGVKGTYYFDQLLNANSKWDFYLAASAGIAIHSTRWEQGYDGDVNIAQGTTGIYLDGHIGAEYHASSKLGLFLDLSTGLSTFGLAVHF